ncbi:chitin synthase-domain-containing protein, partial [Pilobolus umbonatus]
MRVARNNSQYMRSPSCHHLVWIAFIKLSTLLIPDTVLIHLLGLTTIERRSAWREKIALFLSYLLITVLFYFWLEYITTLFCDPPKTYYFGDVYTNNSILTSINGDVLKMGEYGNATEMTAYINAYPAMDLSPMFPRFMLLHRTGGGSYSHDTIDHCINHFNYSRQADNWLEYKLSTDAGYLFENNMLVSCPIPGKRNVTGAPCFYSTSHLNEYKGYPKKGSVRYNSIDIYNNFTVLPYRGTPGNAYVILDGKVLDVTDYLQAATRVVKVAKGTYSRALHLDRMFLPLELTIMLFINTGMDITDKFYAEIDHAADYKECLMTLFYHGVVTGGIEEGCSQINLALWITLGCFLLYFILKLNLANLSRLHFIQQLLHKSSFQSLYLPSINTELLPYTLLLIPCYAEAADIIKQTFDSLARNNYPDNRKLLCFVCDGVVKSKSSSKENYLCILEALGYSSSKEPEIKSYVSLGQGSRKINYAKVYAGFYESGRNRVPFVMVVKIGSPREEMFVKGGRAPGNRGKRDSIVIIMSFLERCTDLLHKRMTPLEFELFNQCYNVLGIDPRALKYMLITDGDTQVQADVIHKLIFRLESDPYILAINGHIRPANPEENIMTMLQIFPNYLYYYTSFAYEACLGTVTSINGGFVMYRLWKDMAKSNSSSITASSQRYTINNFSNQSIISDTSNSISIAINRKKSRMTDKTQQLPMKNFFNYHDIIPICIHPTVLRGLAAVKPNSLHQETVLLQGEDQYLSVVLLQSHPKHKLAFESEAIAYSTLPTNFFALQGLQVRNIRSTFHNHIEVLRIARHLGFMYWIITLIKIIDMIFCMPITAYLYTVYIRYFLYQDLAFGIVAGSFSILVVMHVFYFACRRQFKYLVWFLVYVVISLPLYNLYFPILAAWCSNDSHLWYDVWPTQEGGYRNRLHGIIDEVEAEDRSEKQLEEEAEEAISRMRLRDFEISEAQKNAQREREEADMLDAKFTGFPGY